MKVRDRKGLSDDAKAILLLCGRFGGERGGAQPLSVAEYAKFSQFLVNKELRPEDLLEKKVINELSAGMSLVSMERVGALMQRGAAMAFAVEDWMRKGLWILCRSDAAYPRRLKAQLREMATCKRKGDP